VLVIVIVMPEPEPVPPATTSATITDPAGGVNEAVVIAASVVVLTGAGLDPSSVIVPPDAGIS